MKKSNDTYYNFLKELNFLKKYIKEIFYCLANKTSRDHGETPKKQ